MTRWVTLVEAWMADGSIAERLCLTLAHSLWQFALLAFLVWMVESFGRRLSSAVRYRLTLALLFVGLTAVPLTLGTIIRSEAVRMAALQMSRPAPLSFLAPADSAAALFPVPEEASAEALATQALPSTVPAQQISAARPSRGFKGTASRWIVAFYGLGVCVMLGRLVRGVWQCQRVTRKAQPIVSEALLTSLSDIAVRWKLRYLPRLVAAHEVAMPCVMGLLRPTIIFPLAALNSLSPAEFEMILAHELAHVRRRDLWAHLVQRLAEALLFFNPGMWYVSRRISLLREYCCDELACERRPAEETATRMRYARALVHLAELQLARSESSKGAQLVTLAAAGGSPSQLRRRIAILLGEPVREPLRVSRSGLVAPMIITATLFLAPAVVVSRVQEETNAPTNEDAKPGAEADPTIEKPRVDLVKVLAIGYGDVAPTNRPRWWNPDGTPREAPATTFNGRRNPQLMPSPRARQIVFELPDYHPGAAVRFEIKSKSGWSRGELTASELDAPEGKPKVLHEVHAIADDYDEVMTLRVGIADGKWRSVYLGQAGAVAQGSNELKGLVFTGPGNKTIHIADWNANNELKGLVFSGAFLQNGVTAVAVSHNWHGQSTRLIAIDEAGQKHAGKLSSQLTAVETVNQTIFEFPGLRPDEIAEFDFQVQDFTWTTIDNLLANPKPAANAKATISGRIKFADSSPATEPGTLYYHLSPRDNPTTSGSAGRVGRVKDHYSFEVPAGTLWLAHFTEQHAPAVVGFLEVKAGEQLSDVDLVLEPGLNAKVKFEDEDHKPISGAQLTMIPCVGEDTFGQAIAHAGSSDGSLVVPHVAENAAYKLIVRAPGHQPFHMTPVQWSAASRSPFPLTMRKSRPATGRLLRPDGSPAVDAILKTRVGVSGRQIGHIASELKPKDVQVDEEGRYSMDELIDGVQYLVLAETTDGGRVMLPPVVAGQDGLLIKIPNRPVLNIHVIGDLKKLNDQQQGGPSLSVRQHYEFKPAVGTELRDTISEVVPVETTDDGVMAVYRGLIDAPIEIVASGKTYEFDGSESEVTINLDEPNKNLYQNRY